MCELACVNSYHRRLDLGGRNGRMAEWQNSGNGGMAYGMAYEMAYGMAYGMAGMARMRKRIARKGIVPKGTSRALRKET